MNSNSGNLGSNCIRGWIFDVYPAGEGEVVVWVIGENGDRVRLMDKFEPKIYVSGAKEDLERLVSKLYRNTDIAAWASLKNMLNPLTT